MAEVAKVDLSWDELELVVEALEDNAGVFDEGASDAADDDARDFRRLQAPPWKFLGTDPRTSASVLRRPGGLTEITYADGSRDVV